MVEVNSSVTGVTQLQGSSAPSEGPSPAEISVNTRPPGPEERRYRDEAAPKHLSHSSTRQTPLRDFLLRYMMLLSTLLTGRN